MSSNIIKNKPKILVIDDSKTVRVFLKKIFDEAGYYPVFAPEVIRLFDFIRNENPDLILMDIMRADISGYELCKKIRETEETKDIPVIFLTSKSDDESLVKGFEAGGNDFVTKSSHKRILLTRINAQLEAVRLKKELIEIEKKTVLLATIVSANHELNQPLQVVFMISELIFKRLKEEGSINPKDLDKYSDRMMGELNRIKKVLQKMQKIKEVKLKKYSDSAEMLDFDFNDEN